MNRNLLVYESQSIAATATHVARFNVARRSAVGFVFPYISIQQTPWCCVKTYLFNRAARLHGEFSSKRQLPAATEVTPICVAICPGDNRTPWRAQGVSSKRLRTRCKSITLFSYHQTIVLSVLRLCHPCYPSSHWPSTDGKAGARMTSAIAAKC